MASVAAGVFVFATIAGASPVSPITNGGFENGNLNSWNTANAGAGSWFAWQKVTTPLSGLGWFGAAEHEYAAVSDTTGPGTHILYRLIDVGKNTKIQAFVYYKNRVNTFCSPPTLDYTGGCNQQYRIDILQPGADPFSMNPGDILKTLFHTSSSSHRTMRPDHMKWKLGSISGTVMLRFAEVDNQEVFNASVDNVVIDNG